MFFKRENHIHDLLISQIDKCIECYEAFVKYFKSISNDTTIDVLTEMSRNISKIESEGDSIRKSIIKELINGALLPSTRRDIKILIETIDKIPNKSEEILKQIMLQNIKMDDNIKEIILNINDITNEQLLLLKSLIHKVFLDLQKSFDFHKELEYIEDIESKVDRLESTAIKVLYDSNHELAYKNQLKSLISELAEISDIIEDISDNIEMIIVMRKV